ncbi:MAG: PIG-L deacetylase family protein [Anaerolineales bacterium]
MHVFLSPHLDDAALSCGGIIGQLVARGEAVHVITIMAGFPPQPLPRTPLIEDLHDRWALGADAVTQRRAEDQAALGLLGATVEHHDVPDCPYRMDKNGQALYTTNVMLFGAIHPDDPAREIALALPAQATHIYAPLGAGGHVDHRIVSELGQNLMQKMAVFFYEEYPYSASSGEGARITYGSKVQLVGSAAVEAARARFSQRLHATTISLSPTDLRRKIDAIACYASQLSTFWHDHADMAARVEQYAREVAPDAPNGAERLWIWKEQPLS